MAFTRYAVPEADFEDSETSTDLYVDHESFESFAPKVESLCRQLWPDDRFHCRIQRMRGGSDNRIVGVNVSESPEIDPTKKPGVHNRTQAHLPTGDYVLRIPRSKRDTFEHDQRILKLAQHCLKPSGVDVPLIVHFDRTANVLGSPYVLQRRLRGSRLDFIWDGLNNFQRQQLALELGRVYMSLQSAENSSGGIPDLSVNRPQDRSIQTFSFPFPQEPEGTKHYFESKPPQALVIEQIERWHKLRVPVASPWLGIAEMVRAGLPEFDASTSTYFLCHGDLFPRNILVQVFSERIVTITGILDWDSAHFAPAVVAFAPPAWLWVKEYWQGDEGISEEELWDFANSDPDDEEDQIIKGVFDNWLSRKAREAAYGKYARLTRKIWACINDSKAKSWVYDELAATYKDWIIKNGNGPSAPLTSVWIEERQAIAAYPE